MVTIKIHKQKILKNKEEIVYDFLDAWVQNYHFARALMDVVDFENLVEEFIDFLEEEDLKDPYEAIDEFTDGLTFDRTLHTQDAIEDFVAILDFIVFEEPKILEYMSEEFSFMMLIQIELHHHFRELFWDFYHFLVNRGYIEEIRYEEK